METQNTRPNTVAQRRPHRFAWLVYLAAGLIITGWLFLTPTGVLGKADAIGYAVCHRIDARSFHMGDRQMPLCSRCSGMYLGALVGILYQFSQGRRCGMPSRKVFALLAVFFLAFAVDGGNSYLHLIQGAPSLYEPRNWLRLVTGTGMGVAISAVLVPVFNQTVWATWDARSALGTWRQVGVLLALEAALAALLLTEFAPVLYPLAILSALTVLLVLSMVYSMVLVMLFRAENRFTRPRQLLLPLAGGLIIAMLQIAGFDAVRYWLTGTWEGFKF